MILSLPSEFFLMAIEFKVKIITDFGSKCLKVLDIEKLLYLDLLLGKYIWFCM